jgi:hypothetical protein
MSELDSIVSSCAPCTNSQMPDGFQRPLQVDSGWSVDALDGSTANPDDAASREGAVAFKAVVWST